VEPTTEHKNRPLQLVDRFLVAADEMLGQARHASQAI